MFHLKWNVFTNWYVFSIDHFFIFVIIFLGYCVCNTIWYDNFAMSWFGYNLFWSGLCEMGFCHVMAVNGAFFVARLLLPDAICEKFPAHYNARLEYSNFPPFHRGQWKDRQIDHSSRFNPSKSGLYDICTYVYKLLCCMKTQRLFA